MAGSAGDDPFGFDFDSGDDRDNDPFCYDPFEDYDGDGDEDEGLIGGHFALNYGGGGQYCISDFAFRDGEGDGGDVFVGEGQGPLSSHDEPILETLGRSFDSDGGLSQFYPHLVPASELIEDTSGEEEEEEEEMISRNALGGGGSEFERGAVVEETADEDDDGIVVMLNGFTLDSRPVVSGYQGLVNDAVEEATSDDDVGEVGGLMLSGFDLVAPQPQVTRPFRMVVGGEDTDSDDADLNLVDVLARRVGEAALPRRLPASRAVVDGLPEVALSDEEASHGCAVCKDGVVAGQSVLKLPCKHYFHGECIRPWLAIRNTCPVCRFELPTGDAEYDSRRSRSGVVSVAQQGAPAQSGGGGGGAGAGAVSGVTEGAGDDAAECPGEDRPGRGTSR